MGTVVVVSFCFLIGLLLLEQALLIVGDLVTFFVFQVATVMHIRGFELAQQVSFLAQLAELSPGKCEVVEEAVLILCISFALGLELFEEQVLSTCLQILGLVTKEHFFVVSVVEDVRVHSPSKSGPLLVVSEANRVLSK